MKPAGRPRPRATPPPGRAPPPPVPAPPPAFGWGVVGVVGLVLAAYWPVLQAGFIWDDNGHVTAPALRTWAGLGRIWFQPGATQQYYPVLHTAFWIEHRLWGDAALGYHLLNLAWHALAAILVARVVLGLASEPGPGGAPVVPPRRACALAWLTAALFAVHPLEVETVAWISEQKNTLSAVFYLLALLAYRRFEATRRGGAYAGATLLFLLAVLSKTVAATLPAALLVLRWWQGGTLAGRRDVRPLLPWFAIAAAAGATTAWVEHASIGAQGANFQLGLPERLLLAGRAPWFYLGRLLWPHPLIFIYPRWVLDPRDAAQWLGPAATLLGLAGLVLAARRRRGPLAAALLFGGTLFPALGFINVYPFVFSFVADHFQYLAGVPLLALAAAGGVAWAAGSAFRRAVAGTAAALVIGGLAVLTWRQAALYQDSIKLYTATLARNPDCWLAHDNLGVLRAHQGRPAEAAAHYENAIRLKPDYPEAYNNLGNLQAAARRWREAGDSYAAAVRLRPTFGVALVNWGNALAAGGQAAEAEARYRAALVVQPDLAAAHYRLGSALANRGDLAGAVAEFTVARRLDPDDAPTEANLGFALASLGRFAEARPHLKRALRLNPRYAEAHAYLGFAWAAQGQPAEAVRAYRAALALNPRDREVHYQLAQALRALGRTGEAADEMAAAQARP